MPEIDLVVFDTSVSVPAPLSLQVRRFPHDSLVSVIVERLTGSSGTQG